MCLRVRNSPATVPKHPTEAVAATLYQTLPKFLISSAYRSIFKKFLRDRIDHTRSGVLLKAG